MLNILPFIFLGLAIAIFVKIADGVRHGWSDEKIAAATAVVIVMCIGYSVAGACHFEVLI